MSNRKRPGWMTCAPEKRLYPWRGTLLPHLVLRVATETFPPSSTRHAKKNKCRIVRVTPVGENLEVQSSSFFIKDKL